MAASSHQWALPKYPPTPPSHPSPHLLVALLPHQGLIGTKDLNDIFSLKYPNTLGSDAGHSREVRVHRRGCEGEVRIYAVHAERVLVGAKHQVPQ